MKREIEVKSTLSGTTGAAVPGVELGNMCELGNFFPGEKYHFEN